MQDRALATFLAIFIALASYADQGVGRPVSDEARLGRISGIVLYESGNPATDAVVLAFPTDRGLAAPLPSATTDEFGRFVVSQLWLGKFQVGAKKESEGYADQTQGFYNQRKIAPTVLSFSRPSAIVTVILGPQAGILVGTITDAATNAPLDPCVDFHRTSNANNSLSGDGLMNGQYRILVPSNRQLVMKLWQQDYLPWYFPGTTKKTEAKPLYLRPGEQKTLNIRLQPGNDPTDAGCNSSICFPHCKP
jgi:hypothetical protein